MGKGQHERRRNVPPFQDDTPDDGDDFSPFAAWTDTDFGKAYGDPVDEPDAPAETPRATVVIPAITLPSVPAIPAIPRTPPAPRVAQPQDVDDFADIQPTVRHPRAETPHPFPAVISTRRQPAMAPVSKKQRVAAESAAKVVLVPGNASSPGSKRHRMRRVSNALVGSLHVVRLHRRGLFIFALAIILFGVVTNTTVLIANGDLLAGGQWSTLAGFAGPGNAVAPKPAPDITAASHYVAKYGFDYPAYTSSIGTAEWNRLVYMLPFAYKATTAYDNRYHASIEPQLVVWWTHAEGIGAHINYSNCANYPPRAGYTYFNNIENCPHASFWQLGYGNQFSMIYVLKNAFTDLYGNPDDPHLVQQVGQKVLDYDISQNTYPVCGGYSCSFPAATIDSIMAGIDTTLGVQTADNWWAAVLSRDPAINCYMIAQALIYFNHEATRNWVGNYYYEPYWGWESDKLGDILTAWPALRKAAHV